MAATRDDHANLKLTIRNDQTQKLPLRTMLRELIIKVDNQDIHLCPELTIPTRQTNIPIEHCTFRSHEDIFWVVELLEYNPNTKCWKMKIVDYFANDIKNFDRQRSTREVKRIEFEPFDWLKFERHLTSYQKIKLLDVLHNHDTDKFFREEPKQKVVPAFSASDFSNQTIKDNLPQGHHYPSTFDPIEQQPIVKIY